MAQPLTPHADPEDRSKDLKIIQNDPVPRDEAIYLASLPPGFCENVHLNEFPRRLPEGLEHTDLNPLNPASKLFYSPYMMSSAGQALDNTKSDIIKNRNRGNALILLDSGGYQAASGKLVIRSDADRRKILRWQEANGDVCITLDYPTKQPEHRLADEPKTQAECLAITLEHLRFYQAERKNPDIYWLNVLQGNDWTFADHWYAQVKGFDFQSFAIAGPLRKNFHFVMHRLLTMMHDKRLENMKWLHLLGTAEVPVALMLSAIQRSINKHVNPGLRISIDTGSPSKLLASNSIYTSLMIDRDNMRVKTEKAPEGPLHLGSTLPWPWPSALGQHLTMGDVTVRPSQMTRIYRDAQANNYLIHMNLTTLCDAMAEANRRFKAETLTGNRTFAFRVAEAAEAVEEIFASGGSRGLLHKHRAVLQAV
jgi:hypothetical protein